MSAVGFAPGGGALADDAFERLAASEQRSFWFRARNELLQWSLDRYFPRALSMLEVGCGNGFVLSAIARAHPWMRVVGTDLGEAGLRHARERIPAARIVRADARALPFYGEFDVVGAFDVLEHVPEDDAALAAMHLAVRPGGGIIVTVPQHGWLWSEVDAYSGHQRRYGRRELTRKLAAAGFRPRLMTSFVSLLLPVMAASRAWGALTRADFDPGRELAVEPRLDALLERVMRVEIAAIRCGVRLPAGGSLLAVAERM